LIYCGVSYHNIEISYNIYWVTPAASGK